MSTISDFLRAQIRASDKSYREIARAGGIDAAQISRFVRRERDLTLSVASSICKVLGLELRKK